MIKRMNAADYKTAEELLRLQLPAYQVEAEIIGYEDLPPLRDTVESLMHCEETFFGYFIDQELCGAISFKTEKEEIDIHRLIVHPNHFRKGIAQKLLDFVIEDQKDMKSIIVSTGTKNKPAVHFYQKNGFSPVKETVINPSLSITLFKREQ
ncbi:GNAT family N-acetyltransferase [Jeotgalibacillus sp. S-D1]|uniref:GNAT family N-acetyltransferase n=1 Tax=Jeotgalibacillus sp. S-D1 TaxID=2552189 RepID=UPI00105A78EF|nr:GNAT family N-acetyltransferase [Jeotgalibacillus sp. S-D1]TDL30876.1 GNAT family N-acetyltransferase [Jeotgalibacillus sp. S-D1]